MNHKEELKKECMKFKTLQEAEDYYFSNFARTNNMHDEETASLERWLEDQEINELL